MADKAGQFFKIAMFKAKNVLKDPPLLVNPTADIFPLYSASVASKELGHAAALVATELLRFKSRTKASAQSARGSANACRKPSRKIEDATSSDRAAATLSRHRLALSEQFM